MNPQPANSIRGHRRAGGKLFVHGSELPLGSSTEAEINSWLDQKWIDEQSRRSLYKTFPAFHDCPVPPEEVEPITNELSAFALID